MKVAMVETGGWGGIAHYAWNLCSALAEAGAEVHLFTHRTYELERLPSPFRIERCFSPDVGYLRAVCGFLRPLRALSPDVLHVQSLLSTRFDGVLWPALKRRVPFVFTVHNVRSHEHAPWEAWTVRRCIRSAHAVIAHTEESASLVRTQVRRDVPVRVIHHGDYGFFGTGQPLDRREARRLLDLPEDGPLLLAFGAIRPYKGILGLIAALPAVRLRHPDARVVVAGPLLVGTPDEYRQAVRQARLDDAVLFRPAYVPHAQVETYFSAADAAVYNYDEVTDSGSLRIACSTGTPIVATAVGAFREFLRDGVTGRLVPPRSPARLAAVLCEVLDDPVRASAMAAAARELSRTAWSWRESARLTLEAYREVRSASSGSAPGRG